MFMISLNSMLTLFVFMLVGFICYKKHIFNDDTISSFNKLLLNITAPAMFIGAMNIQITERLLTPSVISIVGGFVFHLIPLFLSIILVKVSKTSHNLSWMFTLTFANIGFLGFPLIKNLFDSQGLFFTSLINISFYVLIFSVGIVIMSNNKQEFSFKDVLLNKAFIGTLIGLIVFLVPYKLPVFLSSSITSIGAITPPLSMIIVGSIFAKINIFDSFKTTSIYFIAFIKLILIPLIVYYVFGFFIDNNGLVKIFTILSATPSAVLGVVLAKEYQTDEEYVSKTVFLTTILSIITLPLITYIITN